METSYSTPVILYEDNHLIAVHKPPGRLTQPDASGARCLLEEVRSYLKDKYAKPGDAFVGLLHRLDRPVGGVVLFAKTSKGASRLSEQFRTHSLRKTYHALVEGHPPAAQTLVHYLGEDAQDRVVIADHLVPGLKRGELSYRTLRQGPKHTLLEVDLGTGRKHQIRAQLSRIGHPVAGDAKYGARWPFGVEGIGLMAYALEFSHPIRKDERIRIALPREPAEDWAAWL